MLFEFLAALFLAARFIFTLRVFSRNCKALKKIGIAMNPLFVMLSNFAIRKQPPKNV